MKGAPKSAPFAFTNANGKILVRAFYIQEVRLESLESYLWRCHK
jgi:hypothetical protein